MESTLLLRTRNRWPALVSFGAQLCLAAVLLTLPLLHPEILPLPQIVPATLAPPRPPVPPAPPVRLRVQPATSNTSPAPSVAVQSTPAFSSLLHPSGPPADAPALGVVDMGQNAALPPGINAVAPGSGPRIAVASPAPRLSSAPARVSSGVLAGLLIEPIRPEYPVIARLTRTEGTVVVDATISRTGSIESAHAVSGPAVLQQAALDAVRRARYRPFLLNGEPTEVQTTITVVFRLGG